MKRFSKDGKLIIPLMQRKKGTKETDEEKVRYVVTEAYCPDGGSIIDEEHKIHGAGGLRMKFKRADLVDSQGLNRYNRRDFDNPVF